MEVVSKPKLIYDVLYGFIELTELEWEITHSPFYQRLRWIKQLGFSCYTFPGAEHTRFGHSIGVMYNAHKILETLGKGADLPEFNTPSIQSKPATFNRDLRLAALLHDIGTFPFSHTTEASYIRFGETTNKKDGKGHPDDHEHLGSFIIKNTDYPTGITFILKKYGVNPKHISDLVKGIDPSVLANQILHSDIDCDRMDYLLRDAHYTGLQYGTYDRDYLLHHFKTVTIDGHDVLTIKHNALHCVEDFLMSRFAWYSQVIRSARGSRFDAIAEEICFYLLEKKGIYRYGDLLDMIENDPLKFYTYNDSYFMNTVHAKFASGELDKNPRIKEMANSLLFEKAPKTIKVDEFQQRIMDQDDLAKNAKAVKHANEKIEELEDVLKKEGGPQDWLLADLPKKDIIFARSQKQIVKRTTQANILLERDPVKILRENGEVQLLVDIENSVISKLAHCFNFVPNVFCSESAYSLFEKKDLV